LILQGAQPGSKRIFFLLRISYLGTPVFAGVLCLEKYRFYGIVQASKYPDICKRNQNTQHMNTQIEILDYDLLDLVAVVSTPENRPDPNTFSFNFTREDVAIAAIELGIIGQPYDMDGGERGQAFRIGYQMAGENGNCQYFTFAQMVEWIGGADREAIVLNLAMQKPEISNRVISQLI